jgi:Methyltransferase domain
MADLYNLGYQNQVSIDFSSKAIEAMMQRHSDLNLECRVMDVKKMEFADNTFDIATDQGDYNDREHQGTQTDLKREHGMPRYMYPCGTLRRRSGRTSKHMFLR